MTMIKEAINTASLVYQKLGDQQSQDIFRNRLLFSVTGDWSYIRKITENYLDGYNKPEIYTGIQNNLNQLHLSESDTYLIYGAGGFGRKVYDCLTESNMKIKGFCDRSYEKQKTGYCGLAVFAPEQIKEMPDTKVLIAVWAEPEKIKHSLIEMGIESCRLLNCFPLAIYTDENQYFDKKLIRYSDQEVFLDCGAYDLQTSLLFAEKCPAYKKIIAFEPDHHNWERCMSIVSERKLERTEVLPFGVWDQKEQLRFDAKGSASAITAEGEMVIDTITIDELDEPVTFLKMDIEGAELRGLRGAQNTIRKYQPKLAICIYHHSEDMIQIGEYILSLVPEYRLYLRHYSNYYATETVMYAIK